MHLRPDILDCAQSSAGAQEAAIASPDGATLQRNALGMETGVIALHGAVWKAEGDRCKRFTDPDYLIAYLNSAGADRDSGAGPVCARAIPD